MALFGTPLWDPLERRRTDAEVKEMLVLGLSLLWWTSAPTLVPTDGSSTTAASHHRARLVSRRPEAAAWRALAVLRAQVMAHQVSTFRFFYYPVEIDLRGDLTPDRLEGLAKAMKHSVAGPVAAHVDEFVSAIDTTEVLPPPVDDGDFRYGLVFYDARKRRMASVYMTEWKLARVNGRVVTLKGGLPAWLIRRASEISPPPKPH